MSQYIAQITPGSLLDKVILITGMSCAHPTSIHARALC